MLYRGPFALAALFCLLGVGYLVWWQVSAVPPAKAGALSEMSGTLLQVDDISRSAGPVHPVLELHVANKGGAPAVVILRNRNVTLGQFRSLVGDAVRVRYAPRTGVVYEFFAGEKQLVTYKESFRQQEETYLTLLDTAKIVFGASALFALLGLVGYVRARRAHRRRRNAGSLGGTTRNPRP